MLTFLKEVDRFWRRPAGGQRQRSRDESRQPREARGDALREAGLGDQVAVQHPVELPLADTRRTARHYLHYSLPPLSLALHYLPSPFSSALHYLPSPFSSALHYLPPIILCTTLSTLPIILCTTLSPLPIILCTTLSTPPLSSALHYLPPIILCTTTLSTPHYPLHYIISIISSVL